MAEVERKAESSKLIEFDAVWYQRLTKEYESLTEINLHGLYNNGEIDMLMRK